MPVRAFDPGELMSLIVKRPSRHRHGSPPVPLEAISDHARRTFLETYQKECDERIARQVAKLRIAELERLVAEDRDFAAAYGEIKAQIIADTQARITATMKQKAINGDVAAAKFLYSTEMGEAFGSDSDVNINIDVTVLTDEELQRIATAR